MKQLLILLALFPLSMFSSSSDSISSKRFSVGFTFSPDYCYRVLKPDVSDNDAASIANLRNSIETPKLGYTGGFNFMYRLNKRFAFESGVLFSDKGEKTSTLPTNYIVPDPSLPINVIFVYHYYYLDIPLKADIYLLNKRTKIYLTAGASCNVFVTEGIEAVKQYADSHVSYSTNYGNSDGYSRLNFAYFAGLGFSHDFNKRFSFKVEPTYRRSINSIINAPIKGYLYSMGLNTGVYYSF